MNRHLASRTSLPGAGRVGRGLGLAGVACTVLLCSATLLASSQKSKHLKTPEVAPESLESKVASSIKTISGEKSSSVVRIRCSDGHGEIVGTGFYIDPNGTICTLAGIVEGAHDITIEQGGKRIPATLLALDPRSGVAFLKSTAAEGNDNFLSPLSTTDLPLTNALALTPVIGIGYPREQEATPALGMITGSKNHEGDCYFCVTHLTASIPLSEGEGGSPILDLSGNLLGIVICGNTQLGLCTILPAVAIEQLHHNFLRYGNLNPGWVGAVVEISATPQKNSLTRIASIEPGSPAETAGLHQGDILVALGCHSIHVPEDVLDASFYFTAGENLQVKILRGGAMKTLTLQCAERPAMDAEITTNNPAMPTASLGILGQ